MESRRLHRGPERGAGFGHPLEGLGNLQLPLALPDPFHVGPGRLGAAERGPRVVRPARALLDEQGQRAEVLGAGPAHPRHRVVVPLELGQR